MMNAMQSSSIQHKVEIDDDYSLSSMMNIIEPLSKMEYSSSVITMETISDVISSSCIDNTIITTLSDAAVVPPSLCQSIDAFRSFSFRCDLDVPPKYPRRRLNSIDDMIDIDVDKAAEQQ